MIKLFILDEISGFSSDAVFKICLGLEERGLTESGIERFASFDELLDALVPALEMGDHVIVAPENEVYNSAKRDIIGKLILEESSSAVLAEVIARNAGDEVAEIDMSGHCLVPLGSKLLVSSDGLFSGFSLPLLSGKLTCMPLDFMRADEIIEQFKEKVIEREERLHEMGLDAEIEMPDVDLVPCIKDMVDSLADNDRSIALSTGEATMWVYNLYDKVDGLTERIKFVEVTDDPDSYDDNETESAMVIRHAREAMLNVGTDFGGAISDIYSMESDEGKVVYFAYAAVVDKSAAKAKKINISDPENLAVILPHALTLMSEMVIDKADTASRALALREREDREANSASDREQKTIPPKIILFAVCALVAVILPIILVFTVFNEDEPTAPSFDPNIYATAPVTTASATTQNPFGAQSGTTFSAENTATEATVTDVSATSTTSQVASESGVFTFYVFGYGHGVGMSQHGANYLANQGWSYAEILAHYYYDANTKIVTGDKYPATIKYAGSDYETREYLAKALEEEMGASFHAEALKAQAVAIYTFAKHYSYVLDASAHAFTAGTPSQACYAAVDFVMQNGLYISYMDDVALTPFHSMSAGITTSYHNVWGQEEGIAPPYLSGGRESYGDYENEKFKSTYVVSSKDLKDLIEGSDSSIKLTGDPSTWLSIVSHDTAVREDIGYVSKINVGGKLVTGNDFRTKLLKGKIRSHCFIFTYTPDVPGAANGTTAAVQ